ncbi:MAG TPA: ABC transporter ATP-binding protein [Stellaceae bacterium]|nr:ABC transporter ATP-binding protein [Stellaceae bacterium]
MGPLPGPERAEPSGDDILLDVRHLEVAFRLPAGRAFAVRDVSFTVRRGETVALVGESGSGKSVTSLAILGLTPPKPFCDMSGQVLLRARDGGMRDLLTVPDREMRQLRGAVASMIFQEPMTSFNPVLTIGDQIAETLLFHLKLSKHAAFDRSAELLDLVGIPDARKRLANFPHQLSGGMRQRAMIAMALACEPDLLIADEPTTALDVTIQAQIIELLQRLQQRSGMAIIFITHNLGVVAEIADRVMVMYGGRIVEQADVVPMFKNPLMPYTKGLLQSVPRLDLAGRRRGPLAAIPGNVPTILNSPPGCGFEPRCGFARLGECEVAVPVLEEAMPGHAVRCVRWSQIAREAAS